jgi:hypothetical protein
MDLRPPTVTLARHRLERRTVLTRRIPTHLLSKSKHCVGGSSARNRIRVAPHCVKPFYREHLTLVADELNEKQMLNRGQPDGMPVERDLSVVKVDVQGAVVEAGHEGKLQLTTRPPPTRR